MGRTLKIAIDCRITNPRQGIGTAVLALAKALSEAPADNQDYTFIVREDMQEWLKPYIHNASGIVGVPKSKISSAKEALADIPLLRSAWNTIRGKNTHVSVSDGYVEANAFDVVHFPTQTAYITNLPSIYQPWDLQHLHYPEFFSSAEYEYRERHYRKFCERATYVCVQTAWTRQDLIASYNLDANKVVVVPWGSVFDAYNTSPVETTLATVAKYQLPSEFFLYPAVTWPHKNHAVIIRALHCLRRRYDRSVHVYFTGSPTKYRSTLEKLARELTVSDQVHFLGFLPPAELRAVFHKATAMIFASKFEGFGLPILEAFHAQLPVICSSATTLPEVAREGALYFSPDSPDELAALMSTILDTPALRQELATRGTAVLSRFSIQDTARSFQQLYNQVAGVSSNIINSCRDMR